MNLPKEKEELKNQYYSWLNKNQTNYKKYISASIDAIYDINDNQVNSDVLLKLKQGLELPYLISYPLGEYVCHFAQREKKLENLLLELVAHPKSKVRLNIIIICFYNKPEHLVKTILSKGLLDKSKANRAKTCDVILRLRKTVLNKDLLNAIASESDEQIMKTMQWTYDLVTKNWSLVNLFNNNLRVSVQLKDGGITGFDLNSIEDKENIELIENQTKHLRNYYSK